MKPVFHWSARSQPGKRKLVNDDSFVVFSAGVDGSTVLSEDGQDTLLREDFIFAVSDGMGGGNAGDFASRLILDGISQLIPKTFKAAAQGFHPDYLERLEEQIKEMHIAVNDEASSNLALRGMGATLVLAWFTPDNLYFANVGDSRLYLMRGEELTQLSVDHTFAWSQLNRGEISEREFRAHPRRSALYETVGGGHQKIRPYVAAIPYQKGDSFLLCSDGVIDGLWEKNIQMAFLRNLGSTSSCADALITRAVDNDGSDDTTLIVVHIR